MTTQRRRFRLLWLVGGVLTLTASACSSSDEVVFDSPSVITSLAQESPDQDPVAPPPSSSTTIITTTTTTPPADNNAPFSPPEAPTVEHSGTVLRLPGNLVIDLNASKITALGVDAVALIETDEGAAFLAQPNWAPSGEFVAWARAGEDGGGSVVVGSIADGSIAEYALPYVPFYLHWRPDSAVIALLGSVVGAGGSETGLTTVDLDTRALTTHYSSRSFYLAWSPDGTSMITHLDQTQLELYDLDDQSITSIGMSTGRFEAAQWTPDGSAVVYVRPSTSQSAGIGGLFAAQPVTIDELVRHDTATDEVEVVARAPGIAAFALAPDGSRIAYNSNPPGDSALVTVLDLSSLDEETFEVGIAEPWQWSPDGRHILLMAFDPDNVTLTYRVWTDGDIIEYSTNRPTATFLARYLPFWGQYSRSHSLWAPDSSGFVFPTIDDGTDLIFFQPLGEILPGLVSAGSMATFTPIDG